MRGHPWVYKEALAEPPSVDRASLADPLSRENVHVQTLCRASYRDDAGRSAEGSGILELLCIGDHPTGLRGILDGYHP